jgi:hypothetical protein
MLTRFRIYWVLLILVVVLPWSSLIAQVESDVFLPHDENVDAASGFDVIPKAELLESGQNIETTNATRMIDFESQNSGSDIENSYRSLGIFVKNARVLRQGVGLNTPHYYPNSGLNVIADLGNKWEGITFDFDESKPSVFRFGFFYTISYSLRVRVYDAKRILLFEKTLKGPNYYPLGIPNQKFEVKTKTPIAKVEVMTVNYGPYFKGVNSFVLDDVFFDRQIYCGMEITKYFQTDQAWAKNHYGDLKWQGANGFSPTIENWGCALTASAMLLNQQSEQMGIGETNPSELNAWLQNNGGYLGGFIIFSKVEAFAAEVLGLELEYVGKDWLVADSVIQSDLCSNNSVIMEVQTSRGQHFVLGTGFNADGYLMNDPLGYESRLLTSYPNGVTSTRNFAKIKDHQDFELVTTGIYALEITDPYGREMRFDYGLSSSVITEVVNISNIQAGKIFLESMSADFGDKPESIYALRAMIQNLQPGLYKIQVSSLEGQRISMVAIASNGKNNFQQKFERNLEAGAKYQFELLNKPNGTGIVFSEFGEVTYKSYLPIVVR